MSSKYIRDTVNKVKAKYQESDPYRLAAAMHIIGHGFTSHDSPVHAMVQCHTAQGNIAEQLVSQSVTCPNFRSYHNDVSTIFSFSTL